MSKLSTAEPDPKGATPKKLVVPNKLTPTIEKLLGQLWSKITLEQLDNVFPPGLSNPVSYWVRLNAPLGLEALIDRIALGKEVDDHSKKGWHAGMCVLIALRVNKGGMDITENEAPMWNNYSEIVPGLSALIFDQTSQRTNHACVKLGGKEIPVLNDQCDPATLKWLAKSWPKSK
jgi:hypothetical protein